MRRVRISVAISFVPILLYLSGAGLAQLQAKFILGLLIFDYLWLLFAEPVVVILLFVFQIRGYLRQMVYVLSASLIYLGSYYYWSQEMMPTTVGNQASLAFFLLPSTLSIVLGWGLVELHLKSSDRHFSALHSSISEIPVKEEENSRLQIKEVGRGKNTFVDE